MRKNNVLNNLILNSGLSYKEFASKADLPYTTLLSILDRGIYNSSVSNVVKICKVLNLTIEQLLSLSYDNGKSLYLSLPIVDDLTYDEKQELFNFINYLKYKRNRND